MAGLVCRASLLSFCALLVGGLATAQPDPSKSTIPRCIILVGDDGTSADPLGTFQVTVLDAASLPVANSNVVLDFSACTETHVATQTAQRFTGMTVTPASKRVSAVTSINGVATFDIEGGMDPALGTAAAGCIAVSADNVPMGTITATAINSDVVLNVGTLNPVNAADVASMLQGQLPVSQPYKAGFDLNCDGAMNAVDVATLLNYILNGRYVYDGVCPSPTGGYAW